MAEAARPSASVKFSPTGRLHKFLLSDDYALDRVPRPGDDVVVRTEAGPSMAKVVGTPGDVAERRPCEGAGAAVVRRASADDVVARLKQQRREQVARQFCLLKIRERGLPMKLTMVEQLFDGSRLIFYFTADGRVDFRELVRDLAAEFRTRIEMRQIGVRDEAKLLGGYGSCGRPLCCTTWLQSFEPVSIRMAKQQQLSLNPSKLSGVCGRLKCCLRYELPNAKGERYAGCAHEQSCGSQGKAGGGCGGGCGSGGGCSHGCGSCGSRS